MWPTNKVWLIIIASYNGCTRKELGLDEVLTQHNITGEKYLQSDHGAFKISVCILAE